MTFKMKKEPVKPVRVSHKQYTTIDDGDSLERVLEKVPPEVPHRKISFSVDLGFEYDCAHVSINYPMLESTESYDRRFKEYKRKKEQYDKWYSENSEAIEEHKRLRALYKENDLFLSKERKKAAMQKEFDRLKKALEKL